MLKLKKVVSLLVVCLLALSLVACGGSKGEPEGTSDNTASATEEVTPENTTVEQKEVELEVWSFFSPGSNQAEKVKGSVDTFLQENPKIKVNLNFVGQDATTKMRPRFAQKDTPDLLITNSAFANTYAKDELLSPITKYLEGKDYTGSEKWRDTFLEGTLQPTQWNGEDWAAPEQLVITSWFYNKKIFSDLNLEAPKTWNEFLAVCEKIKGAGIAPIATDGNVDAYLSWFWSNLAIRQAGYDKYMEALKSKDGAIWEDPDFIQAAVKLQKMIPYFQNGFKGTQYPGANALLVQGKGAMMYIGSWLPQEILPIKPEGFEMGMFMFPTLEDGKETKILVEAKTNNWVMPKYAKNPEQAATLMKYFTSKKHQDVIASMDLHPTIKGVESPAVVKDVPAIIKSADIVTPQYNYVYEKEYTEWSSAALYPNITAFLFGDIKTPEEFMKKVKEKTADYYTNN